MAPVALPRVALKIQIGLPAGRRIRINGTATWRATRFMSTDSECLRIPQIRPDAELSRVFAPEGPLAANVQGYRPRSVQIEMANAVSLAIAAQDVLVCEAGTGTGKTFAYLVPALLSGKRTIISTGTRNLQEQLFHRDLPLTRKALEISSRCALLKGRSNYLCRERLKRSTSSGLGLEPRIESDLATIRDWAGHTMDGDIAELADVPENAPAWRHATSTSDNCLRQECPSYSECHLLQARRNAIESDLLVVNHHLLFADMVLREEGFGELLPGAETLVLDEAHQLAETATRFFGTTQSSAQITDLLRDAESAYRDEAGDQPALPGLVRECEDALRRLHRTLSGSGHDARLAWSDAIREPAVERAADWLATSLQCFTEALEPMAVRGAALQKCFQRAETMLSRLRSVTRAESEGDTVCWVETRRFGFTVHASPLDVAPMISERVYAQRSAWVFTSATLAIEGTLAHFARGLGLDQPLARIWPSPFDFERQALCYLPPGLPDPRSAGYCAAFLEELVAVVEATRGRAFVLFTSYKAMEEVHQSLPARIPYPVLLQGSTPRNALLERFRRHANAVLLGTYSFWEGVDVRGEALSCVVIDKLPFASPYDPVLRARIQFLRESGRDPFLSHQLPQAVLVLKQGVGRLLRDPSDRGVVVLCDPRIVQKGYGRVFLNSLPPMPTTGDRDAIRSFFTPEGPGVPG